VGDVLLDGPNCDQDTGAWRVHVLEPARALVLTTSRTLLSGREVTSLPGRARAFFDCSWAFVLVPEDGGTRLVVRSRVRMKPRWLLRVASVLRAGDTVMQPAMLAGIRRRVEQRGDRPDSGLAVRPSRLTLGELASVWVDEPVAPFQIALAGQFDATPFLRNDGTVDLPRIRAELIHRAGRVPALRPRVVWTRFGRGRPYRADDPAFDPERHVTCAALPDGMSFTDWCAKQIVRPLDLDRPLWRRAEVVCGLPAARFGMLIVVHHAVADGLTGVALAASLMDAGPRTGSPRREAWTTPRRVTWAGIRQAARAAQSRRHQARSNRAATRGNGEDAASDPRPWPLRAPPQLSLTSAACSARSRMFSSILRIIQMSPNSNKAEKAIDGDNHRYRDRTRVMSRVDEPESASSCHAHVVSPGVPQTIERGGSMECTRIPCLPSGLIGTTSPGARPWSSGMMRRALRRPRLSRMS
jgi:hypothetical protein